MKAFAMSEAGDEIVSPFRLIVRHHVTGIANQDFNEISCFVDETSDVLVDTPDVTRRFLVVLRVLEWKFLKVVDGEWISNDDVELTVVNAHAIMRQQLTEIRRETREHIQF